MVNIDDDVVVNDDGDDVYYTWRSWRSFFPFVVVYFSFVAVSLFVIVVTFISPPLSSRVLSSMALSFDIDDDDVVHGREVVC